MKQVKRIETNYKEQRYWQETAIEAAECTDCMNLVQLFPQIREQTMEGFGGAFTESSAVNYHRLGKEQKKELIEAYFRDKGLRYHLGRVSINSCDFALGNYTYVEEDDATLHSFSIAHDRQQIIPMIQAAMERTGGKMHFLASPWSPPAYMKTNGEMNHGGKLKEEVRELWAQYFVKFIREYREAGVPITAVTVQNEPAAVQTWNSCTYSAEEEGLFVAKHLGPALERAGMKDVDIYVWDHNKELLYQRFRDAVSVPGADRYIAGAAMHWYTGDHFDAIEILRKQYPGIKLMFSEGCVEYSRFADSGEVRKAEMYAHDMIGNFRAGVSTFLDWNLLLDEQGGPNHVGNFCAAPVMLEPEEQDGYVKKLMYYYIGQFSRYIPAESVRIATTQYTDGLEVCAFLTPSAERVLVVLNKSEENRPVVIREEEEGFHDEIAAHSIVTYVMQDVAIKQTPVIKK